MSTVVTNMHMPQDRQSEAELSFPFLSFYSFLYIREYIYIYVLYTYSLLTFNIKQTGGASK